ncbi:non-homologous end joining protein Ku [Amycolatopsis jiangsuensis]|uniref:Non-homologous end joining protein Ku n=1 Tax=Amycolatopsis jiangsuensis TaxID=1181879 RepID=A0A840IS88_9PSEU|nr:Ku protein [Amycolatopsis jiangsuensis]MBB4684018.1 DNA end-binding protein Ku [Amycolatopsis jiangsuensis]
MRPVWQGALAFGLVNVPVRLYKAVEDNAVRFTQFQRGTRDRIRYRRVNERTGDEVKYEDIVRGREVGDGEYVLVEQDELDEIAPGRSRSLEVESFVDLAEVDPVYFDRTYWLAPANDDAERPYVLLFDALARRDKAAVAKFVLHGKEHLALARAGHDVLVLNTLHFSAEVRDPARDVPHLPAQAKTKDKELDMAVRLVDSMTEPWQPEEYHDTYRERVEDLVKAKKAGQTVTPAEAPEEPTKVVDLFEALSKSVRGSRKRRTPDVSGLSKADLQKLAKERDVKGRSKMSRADLEAALKAS